MCLRLEENRLPSTALPPNLRDMYVGFIQDFGPGRSEEALPVFRGVNIRSAFLQRGKFTHHQSGKFIF